MNPYWFNFTDSRKVPMYEGMVTSNRLVTKKDCGSQRLGLHISEGKPGAAGTGTLYPEHDSIIYVLEGSIGIGLNGAAKKFLNPGEGIFIPAGTSYDWEAGPTGWKIIIPYSPPME
jgi:quercetin dioxygenase-like cupin family protein